MGFLAPWFLLLGGAAVVPLLLHLLRRRIGVRVEFPAARYLARAEREHSRTLRMRNLLLMVLRVLLVLVLAAAAARPTARVGGAGHAPTALAVVVDNSMSTGVIQDGSPLLDHFRRLTAEVLDDATPEDRLWLVTADGHIRGGNAAALRDEIDRLRPFPGAGSVRDAMVRALATVEASGLPARQVAVLTDGQRTTWPGGSAAGFRRDVPVVVWAPTTNPPANRAVVSAEARPVRWTPRGAVAARTLSPDSTTYRIELGGRTLARGTTAPGEEAIVRAAPAERGWTAALVEIEPDELRADNVRHFALWIGAAPAVRLTSGAGPFARNAIDVLKSSQRVAEGQGILLASADEATAIPALLFAPGDAVRVGAANRALERLGIPWRFGAPRLESSIARGGGLDGVAVTNRYRLESRGAPDTDTLASVGADAWIVSGPGYVLVGSPLTPAATSLPVSAAFLPWLADVLSARLHGDPGNVVSAVPGASVPRPPRVDALESAAGARVPVSGVAVVAPVSPGAYFFLSGPRRVGALVVNPETEESRLDRWSTRELAARVVAGGARVVDTPEEWVREVFTGAAQRSLVAPLLLVTLLLLVAETLVATTGLGARRQQ